MIPREINLITIEDLVALISEGRTEDRTIEYKSDLPSNIDSEKIPKLLKPVCSFANTDGGDLIYGIRAEQGKPVELNGIGIEDIDQTKLSLEHIFKNGIEPQIRGIHIKEISIADGKFVLTVRVPKSWTAPHRVKNNARFYARNTAGVFELDVPQIKQSFLLTDTISERIKEFRVSRIGTALGEDAPVNLREGLRILLHLVPLHSFTSTDILSVSEYQGLSNRLLPPGEASIHYYLNFDGMVVSSGTEEIGFRAYSQIFRSGILEYVRVYEPRDDKLNLPSIKYEQYLLENYKNGLALLRDLGFQTPIYVFMTLVRAKGYSLGIGRDALDFGNPRPFDRDVMVIPEIELESMNMDANQVMKPLFDVIWNAAGFPASMNFDKNNQWQPKR